MVNPLLRPMGSQWMTPSEMMNPLLGKSSEAVLSASFLSLQLFPGSQSTVQSDRDSELITISRACLPTWHMLFPSSGILLLHLQSCTLFVFTFAILYLCSFFNLAHPLYSKQWSPVSCHRNMYGTDTRVSCLLRFHYLSFFLLRLKAQKSWKIFPACCWFFSTWRRVWLLKGAKKKTC